MTCWIAGLEIESLSVHLTAHTAQRAFVIYIYIYINAPEGCPREMDEGQTRTRTRKRIRTVPLFSPPCMPDFLHARVRTSWTRGARVRFPRGASSGQRWRVGLKIRGPANLAGTWSAQPVHASPRPPRAAHRPAAARAPRIEGGCGCHHHAHHPFPTVYVNPRAPVPTAAEHRAAGTFAWNPKLLLGEYL